ncbi:16S rRNA (adenine(1518)-N(6)/adenine(1519)-N(6))-dimethyltransferase RsmA [Membranihabitans marinus]|uniref:16S rRNA (adenine(1518)-N(6)/adenine(1519)-N(6))- dimethyltransferase RsmA n=1 Tax=Membranihabitans marinus TaxID=1227546 RepID=UPI001F030453|nr:16S rRNA (adenine(1518)-N(6)/adenine(1519)-N(6))-dimethyltransferase RsmA [Membranihabitans marinus]
MRAKKSFGQHFLKNTHVIDKMIAVIDGWVDTNHILEVGPGKGVLTMSAKNLGKEFKAVELDRDMVEYLHDNDILGIDQLIADDVLELNFREVFEGQPFILIGNFPYNISSKIVVKMISQNDLVPHGLGMFQYEMAQRINGKMNTKDYGSLAILTQSFYDCTIIFKVKPGDFSPPPNVMSAVVRFNRKAELPSFSYRTLEKIVRAAFAHRRKKLRNNFFNPDYKVLMEELKIGDLRAEQVPIEVFHEMAKAIEAQKA